MEFFEIIVGVLLIIMALFLVVAVLMQHGKDHRLSGTIAGGAENFFGKTKGQKIDKKLGTLTTIIAGVFCACLLLLYVIQPDVVYNTTNPDNAPGALSPFYDGEVIGAADTTAATEDENTPDTTAAAN